MRAMSEDAPWARTAGVGRPLLIACDFDGTITRQDTLVEILDRYGSSGWAKIQARVVSGEISIREGLSSEMQSVQATREQIQQLLSARIEMDPTFPDFFHTMRRQGIPLVILTGGFDLCVETVFKKSGLWPVPLLSNRLRLNEGCWQVDFPYASARCESCGHCKGDSVRNWVRRGHATVFIGNGVTDRCAAEAAELTFAKDELGTWCRKRGIPAVPFETFTDIHQELKKRQWLS